jgi:TfoX/Sxy family transcriptional regulator of competence genes
VALEASINARNRRHRVHSSITRSTTIDDLVKGHGISKSEVSRQCRAASWRSSRLRPSSTIASMPYDEDLAVRIREVIDKEPNLTERKMFGGLAFLIRGNMAVAASGQGGVLVRVDPATSDELVATTSAYPMEMRGRTMKGWLRVDAEGVHTKRELARWVKLGATYARSLPGKP